MNEEPEMIIWFTGQTNLPIGWDPTSATLYLPSKPVLSEDEQLWEEEIAGG